MKELRELIHSALTTVGEAVNEAETLQDMGYSVEDGLAMLYDADNYLTEALDALPKDELQ